LNEYADWTLEEFNAVKKGLVVPKSIRRNMINNENNEESYRRSLLKLYQDRFQSRRLKRNLQQKFRNRELSEDWIQNFFNENNDQAKRRSSTVTPSSNGFDWRSHNVVSAIKDQGQCGSCYSFATTEVMESAYAIKTKSQNVLTFSPQQIVDCSASDGNYGCDGGNFEPSVSYLSLQGDKIATAASYPYVGVQESCKTNGVNDIQLGNIVYTPIAQGDETAMAQALVSTGPMYIAINANTYQFMYYSAGVLEVEDCANTLYDLDHAVVAVGYGYDSVLQKSYWIVRNSWGTDWGENGYVRMAKDEGNMCGVATEAYSTTLH